MCSHLTLIEQLISVGVGMNVLNKDGETDLVAALNDTAKQYRSAASNDALAYLEIDPSLTEEVAQFREELIDHLPNENLGLTR